MDMVLEVLIAQKAKEWNVPFHMLKSLVLVESGGKKNAMRYEPSYPWLYRVNDMAKELVCTVDTMKVIQSTSWGLCQILGSTAYELGFRGWGADLCKPDVNLTYACMYLRKHIKRYGKKNVYDIIAAYNAGTARKIEKDKYVNQRYVNYFKRIYENVLLESELNKRDT